MVRQLPMIEKVRKGIRNPNDALAYILKKTIPASVLESTQGTHSSWKKEENFYTFEEGGFAGGTKNRPEFCARNFYEVSQLQELLRENNVSPTQSAEIGSGYGRLSPWIAQFSSNHYGIEPNKEAIDKAMELYPNIQWKNKRIQDMRPELYDFDLIVTWTVLQHIPPSSIQNAVEKIIELSAEQSFIVICEETEGDAGSHTWPRNINKYNELFEEQELVQTRTRNLEPSYESHAGEILLFKNT